MKLFMSLDCGVEEDNLVTAEAIADYYHEFYGADRKYVLDRLNTLELQEAWIFNEEETVIRYQ